MAFEFFRKYQKIVLIAMAGLMVVSLVGSIVLRQLFSQDTREDRIGTLRYDAPKQEDLAMAESDIQLLSAGLGVGNRFAPGPSHMEFAQLAAQADEQNPPLTYALLLSEANARDIQVTQQEVTDFLAEIGLSGKAYEDRKAELRADGTTEARLRSAVANWLRIYKSFQFAQPNMPPSDLQLRRFFQMQNEQIDLEMAIFEASDFTDDLPEPTAAEIQEQFKAFASVAQGTMPSSASFGFGYRWPDRVKVRGLILLAEPVTRVTRPSEKEMRDEYRRNKEAFRIPPSTQPSEQPDKEYFDYPEVKDQIERRLRDRAVENRMTGQSRALREALEKAMATPPGKDVPADPFERVRQQMLRPDDGKSLISQSLNSRVTVAIINQPLNEAIEELATEARLESICFPWGARGQRTLDPTVRVSLNLRNATLRQALDDLSEQLNWPTLQWAGCVGFDGVLFPVGTRKDTTTKPATAPAEDDFDPMDMFPVQPVDTDWISQGQMQGHPFLGGALTQADPGSAQWIGELAFNLQQFGQQGSGIVEVGQLGPNMHVYNPFGLRLLRRLMPVGRLVWQLEAADASRPPTLTELSDDPMLRNRVKQDIQVKKGFDRAVQQADRLAKTARDSGGDLSAAAKKEARELVSTGLFSRAMATYGDRQQGVRPGVPELPGLRGKLLESFLDEAFALRPDDVEPPYPAPTKVSMVQLPMTRSVVVLQRNDYVPAILGQYEQARAVWARQYMMANYYDDVQAWFSTKFTVERLDFKWKKADEEDSDGQAEAEADE